MKQLQESSKVMESLLALQAEMNERHYKFGLSSDETVCLFKINSCLYSEYPHHKQGKEVSAPARKTLDCWMAKSGAGRSVMTK